MVAEIDWDNLICSLDYVHIRILQEFYSDGNKGIWVLSNLQKEIKEVSYSSLVRKLRHLQKLGLIKIFDGTKPLVMQPVIGLEHNINSLIKLSFKFRGL